MGNCTDIVFITFVIDISLFIITGRVGIGVCGVPVGDVSLRRPWRSILRHVLLDHDLVPRDRFRVRVDRVGDLRVLRPVRVLRQTQVSFFLFYFLRSDTDGVFC